MLKEGVGGILINTAQSVQRDSYNVPTLFGTRRRRRHLVWLTDSAMD